MHPRVLIYVGRRGQSEINDFEAAEISLPHEHKVFRFEVAMHDVLCMHVLDALEDLLRNGY